MAEVDQVAADGRDPHLGAFDDPVDELREKTALRVLEIPQIHLYQQVHVPLVHYL